VNMNRAIVADRGVQRGIYTAGVLDAFLAEKFNPFNMGCGVSAGAKNLLAYFLEQPGYTKRAIVELTAADDLLVPYRWMTSRNIIDLDGYFDRSVSDPDYWFPYQKTGEI
jgi:predicted patatin/cPLA2 family phospholipase